MVSKYVLMVCCFAVVFAAEDKYTDKYDNINVDEILSNKRLLHAYVECVMDRGRCTPDGKELKDNLKDALENGCSKCTEKQQNGAYTITDFLIKNERGIWKELTEKFDPTGEYRKKYEERAKAKGIVIPQD